MMSLPAGESPAEYITRVMAQKGFVPLMVYNANFIEFEKRYADAQGRLARAVVQFERPGAGLSHEARLAGFSVLVQAQIQALSDAVEERAPVVMRDDLLDIVRAFEVEQPPAVMACERCAICAAAVAEFFIIDGRVVCRECRV